MLFQRSWLKQSFYFAGFCLLFQLLLHDLRFDLCLELLLVFQPSWSLPVFVVDVLEVQNAVAGEEEACHHELGGHLQQMWQLGLQTAEQRHC